jgi:regulator of protease activity HflC (stomatin/prohibitin superfamily)
MLQPNEGIVLTLFGKYQGTDRSEGLRWTNPFQAARRSRCARAT